MKLPMIGFLVTASICLTACSKSMSDYKTPKVIISEYPPTGGWLDGCLDAGDVYVDKKAGVAYRCEVRPQKTWVNMDTESAADAIRKSVKAGMMAGIKDALDPNKKK